MTSIRHIKMHDALFKLDWVGNRFKKKGNICACQSVAWKMIGETAGHSFLLEDLFFKFVRRLNQECLMVFVWSEFIDLKCIYSTMKFLVVLFATRRWMLRSIVVKRSKYPLWPHASMIHECTFTKSNIVIVCRLSRVLFGIYFSHWTFYSFTH